jgi:hypothetical protein
LARSAVAAIGPMAEPQQRRNVFLPFQNHTAMEFLKRQGAPSNPITIPLIPSEFRNSVKKIGPAAVIDRR